jgi:MYXO-CTERM domain-containing protein
VGAGLLPRLYGEDGQSGLAFALLGLAVLAAGTADRRRSNHAACPATDPPH